MATDALVPCVTRSSANMVLCNRMENKQMCVFHKEAISITRTISHVEKGQRIYPYIFYKKIKKICTRVMFYMMLPSHLV